MGGEIGLMHAEVLQWVKRWATDESISVLDIGGRDVNGTCRELFPQASYTVLDALPGPNVDILANAAEWNPDGRRWDLVLCTEVFEHTPDWRGICEAAYQACRLGGRFVVTCATGDRSPHSAIAATDLQPGEHYANVTPQELGEALAAAGFAEVELQVIRNGLDLQATAVRPA